MILSLPAGADVDNWYAHNLMNRNHVSLYPFDGVDFTVRSYTVWPNLIGKGWEVDASDTHVRSLRDFD